MISLQELNSHNYPTTDEINSNLQMLLVALNKVRAAYNIPMIVTSGLRSVADQQRINPSAPKSKHLLGLAADISDPDGNLWKWCMVNIQVLIEADIYLEDKAHTPTWVHMQCVPPKSGKRIFIP